MTQKAPPVVFLAHAHEDAQAVEAIYEWLLLMGLKPWMDKRDIGAGEEWRPCIRAAIPRASFFLACLSEASVRKRGFVQEEFRLALDEMMKLPAGDVFLLPVRLDECEIPQIQTSTGKSMADFQAMDFFSPSGRDRILDKIAEKTSWERPSTQKAEFEMLPDIVGASKKLQELLRVHNRLEAAVMCTDRIAEFLRAKDEHDPFFKGRSLSISVMDPDGKWMAQRAQELREMEGPKAHASNYDLPGAVRALIMALESKGGELQNALRLSLFDTMLPFEIWMFDRQVAVTGLLNARTNTEKQPFLVVPSTSPLFPMVERTLDHFLSVSHPLAWTQPDTQAG